MSTSPQGSGPTEARGRSIALPIALVSLVIGLHALWLALDDSPMTHFDSYAYLSRLVAFANEVPSIRDLGDLDRSLSALSVNGRPPLYQIATVPLVWLGRGAQDAAVAINLIGLAVLAFFVYRLGVLASGPRAGCLAAFLATTYPPLTALVHEYRPHAVFGAVIVTLLWLCTRLLSRPSVPLIWGLGAAVTAGGLIHPSLVGIVSVPTIVCFAIFGWQRFSAARRQARQPSGIGWLRSLVRDPLILRGLLPASLVGAALVALWYGRQGLAILRRYMVFKGRDLVAFRGQEYVVQGFKDEAGPYWYLDTATAALSIPMVVLGLVGLVFVVLRPQRRRWLILLAFLWVVALVGLGETAFTWWKMSVALPMLALLSAVTLDALPLPRLRRGLMVTAGVIAAFNLVFVLFGGGWGETAARLSGARLDSDTCLRTARHASAFCPQPPRTEDWPSEALVRAVRRAIETEDTVGRRTFMVIGGPRLMPPMFAYWLNRHWPEHRLRLRGTGFKAWGGAYNLRGLLEGRLLLYAPRPVGKQRGNYVSATLRLLQDPPPSFDRSHREVGVFAIPYDERYKNMKTMRVLRRVEPLSLEEANDVIEALDLPEKYLGQAEKLLAGLRPRSAP